MRFSDIKLSTPNIQKLPKRNETPNPNTKDDGHLASNDDNKHHVLSGAQRFMNLQNKVIAMLPKDMFPKSAVEMMELNNYIFNNIQTKEADIPREVITRWEHMSKTRKEKEVQNPLNYT